MKKHCASIFLSALLMLVFCASACAQPKLMSRQTDAYFSTVSALFLYDEPEQSGKFAETWSQVKDILSSIEQAVSLSFPDSDISRFNALSCGERTAIDPITAEILAIAFDVHALTDGLYDPTVYPLVDLWGFSPRFNRSSYAPVMPYDRAYENGRLPPPDPAHISALLPLVGLNGARMVQEAGTWYLEKNTPPVELGGDVIQMQLDLGGIAKGYACDRVMAYLRSQGYAMGHFVCGSSSMAILSRPTQDGLYTLTLGKPRPGADKISHYASVLVRDITLSTSSDNTHAYLHDGVRYCHIIDPRTGYPINMPHSGVQRGAASVTLLSQSAARSDAITTALCLMQPQEALDFIAQHLPDDLSAAALYHGESDSIEVMTNIPPDRITLTDSKYIPASIIDEDGRAVYTGTFLSP